MHPRSHSPAGQQSAAAPTPGAPAEAVDRPGLLAAALANTLLALWLYQDALLSGGQRVVGGPGTEVWPFLWGRYWMGQMVSGGELSLYTNMLDFPAGGVLWVKDPVTFLLTLPVQLLAGIPAGFIASGVLLLVLAGVGFFLLARALGVGRWVALLAGLTFAFCPHALGEAYNANTEAFAGGWCALWLWAMLRVLRRPGVRSVLLAGVILAALLITNQYFAWAMALLSVPVLVLALRQPQERPRWRQRLGYLAAAVGVGLLLTAPVAWIIHRAISAPNKLNTLPQQIPFKVPNVTDLKHLVLPMAELSGPNVLNAPFQDLVYPGFLVLALALAAPLLGPRGPWRWCWPAAGLCFLVLSLGPVLMLDGHLVQVGDGPLRLPWYYLVRGNPLLGNMSLPHRLAVPAGLCFSLGLAVTVQGLGQRLGQRRWVAPASAALVLAAVVELLVYPPYRVPLATVDAAAPAHARLLAALPGRQAVLNLPLQSHHLSLRSYMWWQATHGRPIAASLRHSSHPTVARRVSWVGQVAGFEKMRGTPQPGADPGARATLLRLGFGYLVLHAEAWCKVLPAADRPRWGATLKQMFGRGLPLADGNVVYALDPTAEAALQARARRALAPADLAPAAASDQRPCAPAPPEARP